jgi:hypothetical protein
VSAGPLNGPQVIKLDWDTRALCAADLDGDGLVELLAINNDRGRIELLDPQAILAEGADPESGRRSLTTATRGFDLVVGDLDGDDRPDLVYTASPGGLVWRQQDEDGGFADAVRFSRFDPFRWRGTMTLLPLDEEPGLEVVALGKNGMLVASIKDGAWVERSLLPLDEGDPFGLRSFDIDQDGRPDLLYRNAKSKWRLRLRLQRSDGRFGPEKQLAAEPMIGPVEVIESTDGRPQLVWLQQVSHALRKATLEMAEGDHEPQRERYRSPVDDVPVGGWVAADLDHDGRNEWYVADGDGARVWRLNPLDEDGLDAPQAFPSFAGVRSLATGDIDGDGKAELLMASTKERAVGVARLEASGRLGYPQPIPVEGRPGAIAVGDFDGDGRDDVAYARTENGRREIVPVYSRTAGWTPGEAATLADLRTDTDALTARDLDGDGRTEVLAFAPKNPLRLVEFDRRGAKEIPAPADGFQRGLVANLRPGGLSFADLDADGTNEWLIAGNGFVRVLDWSRAKGWSVRDQWNGSEEGEVQASFVVAAPDGTFDVWVVYKEDGVLERLVADEDGVRRPRERFEGEATTVRSLVPTGDGAWIAGRVALERVRFGGSRWQLKPETIFESKLEDMTPVRLAIGDLGGDGRPEAALLDSANTHLLQVATQGKHPEDQTWSPLLYFRIFEQDPSYRGPTGANREPRELLWHDLDGDGLDELLFLVHDRILIYPASP